MIEKTLRSAVQNAQYLADERGLDVDVDKLYVKTAVANEGPRMKRIRPAPMGRAFRYQRRIAHIVITIAEKKAAALEAAASTSVAETTSKPAAKKTAGKKAPAKKAAAKKTAAKKSAPQEDGCGEVNAAALCLGPHWFSQDRFCSKGITQHKQHCRAGSTGYGVKEEGSLWDRKSIRMDSASASTSRGSRAGS